MQFFSPHVFTYFSLLLSEHKSVSIRDLVFSIGRLIVGYGGFLFLAANHSAWRALTLNLRRWTPPPPSARADEPGVMQRLTLRAAILQLLVWKGDLVAALRGHLQRKGAKLACHPQGADESREW